MNHRRSFYDSILSGYGLFPTNIENYGKVKKVTTNQGVFALKETDLTPHQADEFIHALRKLTKLGYNQFVPIFPTKNGEYTSMYGEHTYYLMPWIEELEYTARESKEERLAAELGVIHRLTVETKPFIKENISESYEQLAQIWEMKRLDLARFADQVERNVYLSPFDLTFLTHAYMLDQMARAASEYLEKWFELCSEKQKFRVVLCHGRIQRSHARFSYENEPLLLNFEQACIDTPARDLAMFCRYNFPKAYWSGDEVFRWFMCYERHLPLLKDEKYLISAYLSFPEPIVYAVEAYINGRDQMSELAHTQRLEKRLTAMRKVQQLTQRLLSSSTEQS